MDLHDIIMINELPNRLGFFFGILAGMAVWKPAAHGVVCRPQRPCAEHEAMTIGIRTFREDKWCSWLLSMLAIPFADKVREYTINRRPWVNAHEK